MDIYGKEEQLKGDKSFIPFRFQGQYLDSETDLYYNRFRYYSPETGTYISQDPIGLAGGNPTLYGYVFDSNTEVDIFGLDCSKTLKGKVKEINRQDLPEWVVDSFKEGKYKTIITTEDINYIEYLEVMQNLLVLLHQHLNQLMQFKQK